MKLNWVAIVLVITLTALLGLSACAPATPLPSPTPAVTETPMPTPTPAFTPTPRATSPVEAGWKLAWSDEFDGPAGSLPDARKWTYDLGGGVNGWGNAEWESYTNAAENASLDGQGSLVITAKKTDPATNVLMCWYGECQYTSARLLTRGLFEVTYGRIEARIRVPQGQGLWPAFWMLGSDFGSVGWPNCGEIDIMENIGKEPETVHATLHGPDYFGAHGLGGLFVNPGGALADDFHVYAIEWEKDTLRWYLDGTQYFSVTNDPAKGRWVYDKPFFVLLNVAVGGGWPGYPDKTSVFPQSMLVDYVRVYQR